MSFFLELLVSHWTDIQPNTELKFAKKKSNNILLMTSPHKKVVKICKKKKNTQQNAYNSKPNKYS